MARDIEEFLRKAAERRAAQQQGRPQPSSAVPQPVTEQPRRPQPPPPRPAPVQVDSLEVVDEDVEIVRPVGQTIAEHVKTHIDTRDISQHATSLGDSVGRSGNKMDRRVHKKFDHELGQLEGQKKTQRLPEPPAPKRKPVSPAFAAGVLEMMRSPRTIAQAIIVAELLKRPDFDDERHSR